MTTTQEIAAVPPLGALLPMPDPPERTPEEMSGFNHLSITGNSHFPAMHLGNPDTTLAAGEHCLAPFPTRDMAGIKFPDLMMAFNVDPEAYYRSNAYTISEQGKPPDPGVVSLSLILVASLARDEGPCPRIRVLAPVAGPRAWRRNGTHAPHPVVPGCLSVQRRQCKACGGSASPLSPGATSRQRPRTFREQVAALYVCTVSLGGWSRILDLRGCGVGARPADEAEALGRGGRNLVVHRRREATRGLGFGAEGRTAGCAPGRPWLRPGGWTRGPGARGVRGLTTDEVPGYRPALREPLRNLLFRHVENGSDLVRSERDPDVPAQPIAPRAGSDVQAPGPAGTGAEDRGGCPGFVHLMADGRACNGPGKPPAGRLPMTTRRQ